MRKIIGKDAEKRSEDQRKEKGREYRFNNLPYCTWLKMHNRPYSHGTLSTYFYVVHKREKEDINRETKIKYIYIYKKKYISASSALGGNLSYVAMRPVVNRYRVWFKSPLGCEMRAKQQRNLLETSIVCVKQASDTLIYTLIYTLKS